jgi:hypothetical protein
MYSHASPAPSVIPSTHSGRVLFSKGVYIRRRNGHWEAKIRTGGNFINSAFTEVLMSLCTTVSTDTSHRFGLVSLNSLNFKILQRVCSSEKVE